MSLIGYLGELEFSCHKAEPIYDDHELLFRAIKKYDLDWIKEIVDPWSSEQCHSVLNNAITDAQGGNVLFLVARYPHSKKCGCYWQRDNYQWGTDRSHNCHNPIAISHLPEIVRYFIGKGADPFHKSYYGQTLLEFAESNWEQIGSRWSSPAPDVITFIRKHLVKIRMGKPSGN